MDGMMRLLTLEFFKHLYGLTVSNTLYALKDNKLFDCSVT